MAQLFYLHCPDSTVLVLRTRVMQVREYPDSTISKVLTILKWLMITTFNRKLLEKQWVQNRFASYEVQIGHFFLQVNVNATVSFGNRLSLSIFRFQNFSLDRLTDRRTDCLTWLTNLSPKRSLKLLLRTLSLPALSFFVTDYLPVT